MFLNDKSYVRNYYSSFRNKMIYSDKDIISFAQEIAFGNAPSGYIINLSRQHILFSHYILIAAALSSGNAPQSLTINLSNCGMGRTGAFAIANALSSGNAPKNLTLDLSHNRIRCKAAIAIAKALSSGNAPQNLTLDLSENKIQYEGVTSIIQSLGSGNAPRGLTINFFKKKNYNSDDNDNHNESLIALAHAIHSNQTPIGLTVNFEQANMTPHIATLMEQALLSNQDVKITNMGKYHPCSYINVYKANNINMTIRDNFDKAGNILSTIGWTDEVYHLLHAIAPSMTQSYANAQFLLFQKTKKSTYLRNAFLNCSIDALEYISASDLLDQ